MGFGLYVHIPFCLAKCSYCDFFSVPAGNAPVVEAYLEALAAETALAARTLDPGRRPVDSLYVGGGTPTILPAARLAGVLAAVGRDFSLAEGCEVTVEANPGTVDNEKLEAIRVAGANRLSLGVQSLDPDLLRRIGRVHGRKEVEAAFALARELGFAVNLDLIFGFPGQTAETWRRTLREVAAMGPEHVSTYGLKVETGTPLALQIEQREIDPCPEDEEAVMYEDAIAILTSAGYNHYEISNFARPGYEAKHNLNYWENGEYIGLGAAAHSHLNHCRWANFSDLDLYLGAAARAQLPVAETETVSREQEMSETMFLGLRLCEGVRRSAFARRFGLPVESVFGRAIAKHRAAGLLTIDGDSLKLTPRGLLLSNEVFQDFLVAGNG